MKSEKKIFLRWTRSEGLMYNMVATVDDTVYLNSTT